MSQKYSPTAKIHIFRRVMCDVRFWERQLLTTNC